MANSPTRNTRIPPPLFALVVTEALERSVATKSRVSYGRVIRDALTVYFELGGWHRFRPNRADPGGNDGRDHSG